ncbi:MAG: DegT/DnrJ/EryC1/StrS family aminotransferase [Bacteroidetes bacterium]|nr:DegT/DnrJ/EryC1/StrS family aminotransferase [Bacteroidota bacterium]
MEYTIPLFKLNFSEDEVQAAADTIRSGWISTGPKCEELERLFTELWNVQYAVSLSNCTDALHLACHLCNIKEGDEVICPSLTFAASANAIRYVGATPVFCDITGPEHINIDPIEIKKLITKNTKAIMVVHMAGFPADMDSIMAIAKEYNLRVIEDACHGPLSEYKGRKLGTIGDIGCFSFFSNKNISTGEGGMLITNNKQMAAQARIMRSHGMTTMSYQRAKGHATTYDIMTLGYNFRMDDIRASIAIVQLKKLQADLEKRVSVRKRYLEKLLPLKGVVVPFFDNKEFVSNYIMPIVLTNITSTKRDEIRDKMHAAGIQTSIHYPAVHRFSIYSSFNTNLPKTEFTSDHEITLPMYASLTNEQVDFIVTTLSKITNE